MKLYAAAILLGISHILLAQDKSGIEKSKLMVDKRLNDKLFGSDKHAKLKFTMVSVDDSERLGAKKVIVHEAPREIDILVNSGVAEINNHHYPFDTCKSFFMMDTLIVQFQNNRMIAHTTGFRDKIILHILMDSFYVSYVPFISPFYSSPYSQLVLKGQKLILKKLATKGGDRLMGRITVQFEDQSPNARTRLLTFTGPFDCMVQSEDRRMP